MFQLDFAVKFPLLRLLLFLIDLKSTIILIIRWDEEDHERMPMLEPEDEERMPMLIQVEQLSFVVFLVRYLFFKSKIAEDTF